MTVELLNNPAGADGILDLTGGKGNEQEQEQVTEDEVLNSEGTEGEGQEGDATSIEGSDSDTGDNDSSDSSTSDESDESLEYFFDGQQVEVEVPDEVNAALAEAGVDSKELLGQLFKKDGDFSLEEGTYNKLVDKFGKVMVDGYLSLYKQQNNNFLADAAKAKEAEEAEFNKRAGEYNEMVGGEEGISKIEGYILDNYTDEQIAAYNAVMESDDHQSQMFVLTQVKSMMELSDKLNNGDKNIKLVGDKSANTEREASPVDKGYLTYDEYQTIIEGDKYWTDKAYMQQVDAARIAGRRKEQA